MPFLRAVGYDEQYTLPVPETYGPNRETEPEKNRQPGKGNGTGKQEASQGSQATK